MNKSITIENRLARHEYFIDDTLECGIELRGNEVKSIREGNASIKEAWIGIDNRELVIKQMHITKWKTANQYDIDEKRNRKLLAHKSEINKLVSRVKQDGYTLIPLKIYFNAKGKCKVLLGVCKGKHTYDKRQANKDRTDKREIDRMIKNIR